VIFYYIEYIKKPLILGFKILYGKSYKVVSRSLCK
jgi:hypothetical protein